MSTTPEPTPGSVPPNNLRIGDAERNAAADALQKHLTSGRLTLDEYADRAAVVSSARTQDEVDRVFGDLPPIAGAPGAAGALATTAAQSTVYAAGAAPQVTPESSTRRKLLIALLSAMPFIALILFFVTGYQWYFFLLIPLAGAVLGPFIGNDDDGRGRNRNRNR